MSDSGGGQWGGHFSVQSEFLGRSASSSALRSSSGKGAISRQQHALTWLGLGLGLGLGFGFGFGLGLGLGLGSG